MSPTSLRIPPGSIPLRSKCRLDLFEFSWILLLLLRDRCVLHINVELRARTAARRTAIAKLQSDRSARRKRNTHYTRIARTRELARGRTCGRKGEVRQVVSETD